MLMRASFRLVKDLTAGSRTANRSRVSQVALHATAPEHVGLHLFGSRWLAIKVMCQCRSVRTYQRGCKENLHMTLECSACGIQASNIASTRTGSDSLLWLPEQQRGYASRQRLHKKHHHEDSARFWAVAPEQNRLSSRCWRHAVLAFRAGLRMGY